MMERREAFEVARARKRHNRFIEGLRFGSKMRDFLYRGTLQTDDMPGTKRIPGISLYRTLGSVA